MEVKSPRREELSSNWELVFDKCEKEKSLKNRGKHVQLAALHWIGQLSEVTVGATGQGGQVGRISFHGFFFDGLQEKSFPCRSSREGCSFGKNGRKAFAEGNWEELYNGLKDSKQNGTLNAETDKTSVPKLMKNK